MRIGIVLSTRDNDTINGPDFAAAMRRVETVGFDGLWFFDAIGRGYLNPDPLAAASAAGVLTERIEIGTCILQAPLRHPVELAQRVLTTHMLCGGRLRLGVGAGSTEADFKALDLDFAGRFRRLREMLDVMPRLWNGETADGVNLTPWSSARGGPPILIGSWAGSRWIPIAAERHDGWIGSAMYTTLGSLKDGVDRYRGLGGKRAIVTNIHVDLAQPTQPLGDDDKIDLRCQPEEAARRLRLLADAGFDDAILVVRDFDEASLKTLRSLF